MTAEPWVAVDDVTRHLGVSHNTVYRWIEGKSLPAQKLGHLRKFELSEVEAWVRAGGSEDDRPEGGGRDE